MTMSSKTTPFQEDVAVESYFLGKEFKNIYSQIVQTLHQDSTLMILTGEEGVGKTTLCMQLVKNEGGKYEAVLFLESLYSFNEVVSSFADAVGVVCEEGLSSNEKIDKIAAHLSGWATPVLLIFDQAEALFLATLERIRRMFDIMRDKGVAIHVLFSGELIFAANYKQLEICNFPEVPGKSFTLSPLSFEETEAYLADAVAQNPELVSLADRFDQDFVHHLHGISRGNFRNINRLLRTWLEHPDQEFRSLALPGTMEKERLGGQERWRGYLRLFTVFVSIKNHWKESTSENRRSVVWGVCGLIALIALGGLVLPDYTKIKEPEKTAQLEQPLVYDGSLETRGASSSRPPVFVAVEESVEVVKKEAPALIVSVAKQEDKGEAGLVKTDPLQDSQTTTPEQVAVEKPDETGSEEMFEPEPSIPATEQSLVIIPQHSKVLLPNVPEVEENEPVENSVPTEVKEKAPEVEEEIVVLYPSKEMRYRDPIEGQPIGDGKVTDLERLVQNRFVAGMSWRSGDKDKLYTIKLAQFQGAESMTGLSRLFTFPQYRSLVTDCYLFSKGLNPEVTFVYYGEFRSQVAAEKALKRLSLKIPDYQPGILTIGTAMANIRE